MVVLGIDIGSAQIKAGMVDEKGAIVASRTIETPADLEGFLSSLHDAIRWLLEATTLPAGVGVGCKGIIDPDSTPRRGAAGHAAFPGGPAPQPIWWACPWTSRFSPITMRAWRWPARWSGAPPAGMSNVVMLTLGAGVGGAVIANGQLLRGHAGVAGHLGHLTVDPDGPLCACGNRGCLETVFSARAIEGEAWAAVHRGCPSALTRLFREQPQLATCRTIFQAASEGDEPGGSHRLARPFASWPRPSPACCTCSTRRW